MPFRLRDNSENTKLMIGSEDYILVRPELTKNEFKFVLKSLPENITEEGARMTYEQSDAFLGAVFEKMVVGWSVQNEDGTPAAVTLENLGELGRSASTAIEQALMQHFNGQEATEEELTKSEVDSAADSGGVLNEEDSGEVS